MTARGITANNPGLSTTHYVIATAVLALIFMFLFGWALLETRADVERSARRLHEFRLAQIDLAKGFLTFALSGDPSSTFRAQDGHSLLSQALRTFEETAEKLSSGGMEEIAAFRGRIQEFQSLLAESGHNMGRDDRLSVTLRIAHTDLERQVIKVEELMTRSSQDLSARVFRLVAYTLCSSGVALAAIVGLVSLAAIKERRARFEAEMEISARRESDARFSKIFINAPVAMLLVDTHGIIRARNSRFQQIFGYSDLEIPDLDAWWPLAYPDSDYRREVQQLWQEALNNSRKDEVLVKGGEFRVVCKDGAERYVLVSAILMDEGVLITLVDFTEQRQAESQLRLWAEAFEHARIGVYIVNAKDDTVVVANPAFASLRGYEPTEMIGMSVLDLFPKDAASDFHQMLNKLNSSGHEVFESLHITREGELFPVLLDVTVVLDGAGHPSTRIAFALDLTDRKNAEAALAKAQAEALEFQRKVRIAALNQMQDANAARVRAEAALAALRETQERLKLFVEFAPASLAMFDKNMCYLVVSRRWRDIFSLDQDVVGRSHYELFPDIPARWKDAHRRGLSGEVVRNDEDRFDRSDGSFRWVRWEIRPWHLDGGGVGGIVLFTEDITRQKQAEIEIMELNAELERRVETRTEQLVTANKDLEAFSYSVSHDLRAPLRAITGFSRILLEDYATELDPEAVRICRTISASAGKMGALIDDLLAFSRMGRAALNLAPIDMTAMVESVFLELTQPEDRVRIDFTVSNLPASVGDPALVRQVWTNIISNAIKFSSKRERAVVSVDSEVMEGLIVYAVKDNGCGFDMRYSDKLFGVFQRLHSDTDFEGTGVGLAIIQRIVTRHGGSVWLESDIDAGTVVRFYLGT